MNQMEDEMQSIANKSKFTPSNLKLSDEVKSKLLNNGLKLNYSEKLPSPEKIKVSDISGPEAFSRFDRNDEYCDLENIENLEPIKVAIAEGSQGYFLLDGQRRLQYSKKQKEAKIDALIVGEAVCRSQIAMTRATEMMNIKKPLKILERIHGLIELRQVIIEEFGEDHFFKHGGSGRKQNPNSKESLTAFIACCTGLKQTSVAALLNFGLQIGFEGLQGLQAFDDMKTLSIRKINRINASLKKSKLKEEIEKLTSIIGSNGGKKPELIKAAGKLAYETINDQASKSESGDSPLDNFDLEDLKHEITGETGLLNLPHSYINKLLQLSNVREINLFTQKMANMAIDIDRLKSYVLTQGVFGKKSKKVKDALILLQLGYLRGYKFVEKYYDRILERRFIFETRKET
jgi:hypothetical protein